VFSACFFLILAFTSCSDKSKTDLNIIKALDESIIYCNTSLVASTEGVLASLSEKLNNAGTHEKAKTWYPKAQKVYALSEDAYNNLEKIKTELLKERVKKPDDVKKIFDQRGIQIYDSLMNFRKRLLEVDPLIYKEFHNSVPVFTKSFDSTNKDGNDFVKKFFENVDASVAKAMLTKLQNNILSNSNRIITFCNEQFAIDHVFYEYSSIIAQSSSIVQPGEEIEIVAGIGEFTRLNMPRVYVYEDIIPMDANAIAIYKFKAALKPGKYYVPVKINYIDQDGMQQTVKKEIEYTVANIHKQ
jgi:hypothetical protein